MPLSKKVVLGLSAHYHDSGVAIVSATGEILFAAHEERYSRKKHDKAFPILALVKAKEFISDQGLKLECIQYYENPDLKRERQFFNLGFMKASKSSSYLRLREKVLSWDEQKTVTEKCKEVFGSTAKVNFETTHHLSHAYSSFLVSGFDDALTLVLDGVGEWETSSAYINNGNNLQKIWHKNFPHGLGLFYSAITQLCGFKVNTGEYKLMGLAPYGTPKYTDLIFEHLFRDLDTDSFFNLNLEYFGFLDGEQMINKRMLSLFGLKTLPVDEQFKKIHLDIAASGQRALETVISKVVNHFMHEYSQTNICLAGGVALNCVNNSKIAALPRVKKIFVQPASGDAGTALGAALSKVKDQADFKRQIMPCPYLGTHYNTDATIDALHKRQIKTFQVFDDKQEFLDKVANLLRLGHVGGWFCGRSEFGPRALGNRSIIANPSKADMQQRVNMKVKFRESFRPFAPIILEDEAHKFFEDCESSPFMLRTFHVKDCTPAGGLMQDRLSPTDLFEHLKRGTGKFPAITHVDGSARVQTVNESNGLIYELLQRYRKVVGDSVLINTSFNVRGEPIVETPGNAVDCFLGTALDFLAINKVLVLKGDIDHSLLKYDYREQYELD